LWSFCEQFGRYQGARGIAARIEYLGRTGKHLDGIGIQTAAQPVVIRRIDVWTAVVEQGVVGVGTGRGL